jgi:hypothetical protein
VVSKPQVVFEGKASIRFKSGAYMKYVSILKRSVMHLSVFKIDANPLEDNAAIGHKMGF